MDKLEGFFEEFIGVDFWTALFVLLNTLAIFFVARKFLFKPVHKLISDRKAEVDGMYAKADALQKEAESLKAELDQKLRDAQNESDRIIKAALSRAEDKEREIVSKAQAQAARVISRWQEEGSGLVASQRKDTSVTLAPSVRIARIGACTPPGISRTKMFSFPSRFVQRPFSSSSAS